MTREEFDNKYESQLTFDNPIQFEQFQLYPVPLKSYFEFLFSSAILMIKKDRIPDAKIISMSYMEYICFLLFQEKDLDISERIRVTQLYMLFSLVLQKDIDKLGVVKDNFGRLCFEVDGYKFTPQSFDKFKEIIIFQNLPNYDDIELNPILEEEIKTADRLRSGNAKMATLEKQMLSMTVETGYTLNDIKELTIRKFFLLEKQKDKEISYKIQKTAILSGFVKFEGTIPHYLEEDTKDPLQDKLISYQSLKQKMNH